MMRRLFTFAVVCVLGAGLSCTRQTPTYTVKHAEMRAKIDNGLQMVIVPVKNTPMVHVAVRYEVGANEDPEGKAGLAHLVEHMMFQHRFLGPDKPATFELIPQVATGFNAFTSWDTTHYYLDGRKEDLEAMLRIEAARMGALCETIPPEEFEREREVVRNEIRQRSGTPEGQVPYLMLDLAYPEDHAYHDMVGGDDQQLVNIEFEDVCDFLEKYYTPDRATVIVAGDIDPDEVAKKVKFAFGGIERRQPAPRKEVEPLPELEYEQVVKEVDTERSQVIVMWRLPPRGHDDYEAGQSMVNAVAQRLGYFNTEWDFAASTGTFSFGGDLAPVLVVAAELYDYSDKDDVLDWIWKSTSRIHDGFEEGMFSDETAAVGKSQLVMAMESLSQRALILADMIQFEEDVDFDSSKEYLFHALQRYDNLDGGAFRDFMRSRLKKKNAKVLLIKSSKSGLRGDKRASLEYSTQTHSKDKTPLVNPAEARRPLKAPETDSVLKQAIRYELGNGMRVVMLKTDGMPVVTARLVFDAGSAHEPEDKAGLASVAARFLRPPLGASFTKTGVGFGGSAGQDTTTFFARGVNIYLEVIIKGLERILKAGEVDQRAIERWQHFQKLQFESEDFRRNHAYQMEVAKAIYGPNHPYTVKGAPTEKSYKRIGRDNTMDFIRKHYSARNGTLILAGNFDVEKAKSLISENFGGWGGGHEDEPISADAKARTGPEYIGVINDDPRPQMRVTIAYPGPAGIDGQEAARRVLAAMLNRRMAKIRTELGSTYGTYAGRRPALGPTAYVMGGTVDAARAGESLKAMRDAVASLRAGEDFDADFAVSRRMVMKRLLAESTDTLALTERLANIAVYDLAPNYYDQQVQFVAAVSPAQVRALLEHELQPEKEIIINMATREVLEQAFTEAGIDTVRYVEPK